MDIPGKWPGTHTLASNNTNSSKTPYHPWAQSHFKHRWCSQSPGHQLSGGDRLRTCEYSQLWRIQITSRAHCALQKTL